MVGDDKTGRLLARVPPGQMGSSVGKFTYVVRIDIERNRHSHSDLKCNNISHLSHIIEIRHLYDRDSFAFNFLS